MKAANNGSGGRKAGPPKARLLKAKSPPAREPSAESPPPKARRNQQETQMDQAHKIKTLSLPGRSSDARPGGPPALYPEEAPGGFLPEELSPREASSLTGTDGGLPARGRSLSPAEAAGEPALEGQEAEGALDEELCRAFIESLFQAERGAAFFRFAAKELEDIAGK